ncbi:hypothetical protein K525DRAFT_291229 [Schizophyllum commune Loenen D]|nr:hypothetical protein K525DRAFT_291229 [Schizophyllum commune Loenen D]
MLSYLSSFIWAQPAIGETSVSRRAEGKASRQDAEEEVLTADNVEAILAKYDHPVIDRLRELIEVGGAGNWPPRATYDDTWPAPLRPYEFIYHEVAPFMTVAESCLDDAENRKTIDAFRARLRALLEERIDLGAVEAVLMVKGDEKTESDQEFSAPAWMGFFACIGFLRHAYRWGIVPIVREAQNEPTLEFPHELDVPWKVLQQRFGITSPGGNLTSNVYANCDFTESRGRDTADDAPLHLRYAINVALPGVHLRTEQWNSRMFYEMEEKALPMYRLMALAITRLSPTDNSTPSSTSSPATPDIPGALRALALAHTLLRSVLRFFYDNLKDENLSTPLWMAYCQGFHGWTLDGIDGVSGGLSLVIRVLDSFLGIKPFPSEEVEAIHLPLAQRRWLNYLREFDIRRVARERGEMEVVDALQKMVAQLRIWRMGHMRRMVPYEGVARPERKKMTAGKSVVDDQILDGYGKGRSEEGLAPEEDAMVEHLKAQLAQRLAETR